MYDSVTASNIPRSATMVAGYVDGRYRWSTSDWALFPNAVHVPIAVFASTNDGVVLDVENGDATPAEAPGWVTRRRERGIVPTVYCSASVRGAVYDAFVGARVNPPYFWIADYRSSTVGIPDGAVARQYTDVGPYDLSAVGDYWPGVDGDIDMYGYYRKASTGDTAVLLPNSDFVGSPVPVGVTPTNVDDVAWDDLVGRFARNAGVVAAANAAAGVTLHVVVGSGA